VFTRDSDVPADSDRLLIVHRHDRRFHSHWYGIAVLNPINDGVACDDKVEELIVRDLSGEESRVTLELVKEITRSLQPIRQIQDSILIKPLHRPSDSTFRFTHAELKTLLAEHSASVRYLAAKTLNRFKKAA
jgi:hypothetical protein